MALTARDLFEAGAAAPADTVPPANGSPRFRALVRRQVQSLDWLRVPLRYFDLQAFRPDPPAGIATLLGREPPRVVTIGREWPRIRADIDAGHPCVVGLVRVSGSSPWRLTGNHQVLAWAYEATDSAVTLRVYDPNHPGRDDVELRATIAAGEPAAGRPAAGRPAAGEPAAGEPAAGRPAAGEPAAGPARDRIHLAQSTGEPLLGFFRQPYPGAASVRAWR
jgi:hypothetical protein